jgi:hypothetical protein
VVEEDLPIRAEDEGVTTMGDLLTAMFATDLREMKQEARMAILAFRTDSVGEHRTSAVKSMEKALVRLGEAAGIENPRDYAMKTAMIAWGHSNPQRVLKMVDVIGDYYPRLWVRLLLLPFVLMRRLVAYLTKAVR